MVDQAMGFMSMFNIFIAAYVLFYAIKGTGKVYENDYPKAMKEEHAKFMRTFCWVLGLGLLPLAVLEYAYGSDSIWFIISMIFVAVCIAAYFILFRIKFKQYLSKPKKKKQ